MPKVLSLAAQVDALYKTRQERLKLNKQADALEKEEKALKESIIAELSKSKTTKAIGGRLATATLVTKQKLVAEDWELVYKYIAKNDAFELLQKRLSDPAVIERMEAGKTIPGITKINIDDISVSAA
jgi:hypothetical protein